MIGDYRFTADERTLLVLYLEDTKAQTAENISQMQKELTSAEKDLFLLTEEVLEKLFSCKRDSQNIESPSCSGELLRSISFIGPQIVGNKEKCNGCKHNANAL